MYVCSASSVYTVNSGYSITGNTSTGFVARMWAHTETRAGFPAHKKRGGNGEKYASEEAIGAANGEMARIRQIVRKPMPSLNVPGLEPKF